MYLNLYLKPTKKKRCTKQHFVAVIEQRRRDPGGHLARHDLVDADHHPAVRHQDRVHGDERPTLQRAVHPPGGGISRVEVSVDGGGWLQPDHD